MRKLFYLAITVLVVVVMGIAGFKILGPVATITIDNEVHNPTTTKIFVNGARVAPLGVDGKQYDSSLKFGKNTIEVKGPFIQTYSSQINASMLDKKSLSIKLETRTVEQIITELIAADTVEATDLEVFTDAMSIVGYITINKQIDEDTSYPSMFLYNQQSDVWEEVSDSYVENRSAYSIDPEVARYFSELSSD